MKVLNFGSLNLDYTYHVDHFVQPGETLAAQRRDTSCGGKGLNQSVALARAGAAVWHAGRIGPDGAALLRQLADAGVHAEYVETCGEATGHAVIQVDSAGQNCILLYGGANRRITPDFADAVLAHFAPGDCLVLQNEISGNGYIMEQARRRGLRIAFNPSPFDGGIRDLPLETVDWFLLNEGEGQAMTGCRRAEDMVQALRERYPRCAVLLTLGAAGCLYRAGDRLFRQAAFDVRPVDTTGAGDTFTGYFLAGLLAGLDAPETLRRASLAAAVAVTRPGAAGSIPTREEVLAARLSPRPDGISPL